jgi:hypothetical protein
MRPVDHALAESLQATTGASVEQSDVIDRPGGRGHPPMMDHRRARMAPE